MVERCSCGPNMTSRRDSLMTNWCLNSITLSTLPTPVSLLNGSILSFRPQFFLSLPSLFTFSHPLPPGSPTPLLQSACLGQREAPWEFNCLVFP